MAPKLMLWWEPPTSLVEARATILHLELERLGGPRPYYRRASSVDLVLVGTRGIVPCQSFCESNCQP